MAKAVEEGINLPPVNSRKQLAGWWEIGALGSPGRRLTSIHGAAPDIRICRDRLEFFLGMNESLRMSLKEKARDDSGGILERFDLSGIWVD